MYIKNNNRESVMKAKHTAYINLASYISNGFRLHDLYPDSLVCNSEIESRKFIPVEITLEARPKKYEVTASQIDSAVEKYLNSSKGLSETELADIIKQSIGISVDEIDPTPRCHVCSADSKSSCDCGEVASNE
jgi:hypothetical protein